MSDRQGETPDLDEFLSLTIGGSSAVPERLLLIGRPRDGSVRVREWRTRTMNSEGDDYDVDAGELLESIEQAHSARLPLSQEIYAVRRWLGA